MKAVWCLVALIMPGFVTGFLMQEGEAKAAAVPAPCPKWTCREMHAWWDGSNVTAAWTLDAQGNLDVGITDAWLNTFAIASNKIAPLVGMSWDIVWVPYPFCNPTCGKDAFGVWQARQEVGEVGQAGVIPPTRKQDECTHNDGQGAVIPFPNNDNFGNNEPPIEEH